MGDSNESDEIVRTIVSLAHNLGMEVRQVSGRESRRRSQLRNRLRVGSRLPLFSACLGKPASLKSCETAGIATSDRTYRDLCTRRKTWTILTFETSIVRGLIRHIADIESCWQQIVPQLHGFALVEMNTRGTVSDKIVSGAFSV